SQVAISPDGRTIATVPLANNTDVRLWDTVTNRVYATLSHGGSVYSISYSPRGAHLTIIDGNGSVSLWDTASNRRLEWNPVPNVRATAVAIAPDERTLAIGDATGRVYLADLVSQKVRTSLRWQARPINALTWLPDSHWLAAGTEDGRVYQMDT